MIDEWYLLDENSVPTVYRLKNLEDIDNPSYWKYAYPKLIKLFEGMPFFDRPFGNENDIELLVNRSVTEYELKKAVMEQKQRYFFFFLISSTT